MLINRFLSVFSKDTSDIDPLSEVRTRPNGRSVRSQSPPRLVKSSSAASRRSRFIVLGSSGEVLPVNRKSLGQMSVYSSCNSQSTESFHSAKDTIDDEPAGETTISSAALIRLSFVAVDSIFFFILHQTRKNRN